MPGSAPRGRPKIKIQEGVLVKVAMRQPGNEDLDFTGMVVAPAHDSEGWRVVFEYDSDSGTPIRSTLAHHHVCGAIIRATSQPFAHTSIGSPFADPVPASQEKFL